MGELSSFEEGGQSDFRRRKCGWEESVGPWDRRATVSMGKFEGEWVCDVQLWWGVGERQRHKACEGWRDSSRWVKPLCFFQCTTPTQDLQALVGAISGAARSFSSPSLSYSLSAHPRLQGRERMEKGGKTHVRGTRMEMVTGPSPLLWTLSSSDATWGKSCSSSSCCISMLRWTHCSDRAAVPEGLQVCGPRVPEIPSLLVTQRRGVMPYMACHAKPFANPKAQF